MQSNASEWTGSSSNGGSREGNWKIGRPVGNTGTTTSKGGVQPDGQAIANGRDGTSKKAKCYVELSSTIGSARVDISFLSTRSGAAVPYILILLILSIRCDTLKSPGTAQRV